MWLLFAEIFVELLDGLYAEWMLSFQQLEQGNPEGPDVQSLATGPFLLIGVHDQFRSSIPLSPDELIGHLHRPFRRKHLHHL